MCGGGEWVWCFLFYFCCITSERICSTKVYSQPTFSACPSVKPGRFLYKSIKVTPEGKALPSVVGLTQKRNTLLFSGDQ